VISDVVPFAADSVLKQSAVCGASVALSSVPLSSWFEWSWVNLLARPGFYVRAEAMVAVDEEGV
jgi:hypothetical protein